MRRTVSAQHHGGQRPDTLSKRFSYYCTFRANSCVLRPPHHRIIFSLESTPEGLWEKKKKDACVVLTSLYFTCLDRLLFFHWDWDWNEIEINGHRITSEIPPKRIPRSRRRFKFFERAPKALRIDLGVSGRHPKFAVLISAANELSPLVA